VNIAYAVVTTINGESAMMAPIKVAA